VSEEKKKKPLSKRIFSGPWIWIAAAIGVLIIGSSLLTGGGFQKIDTQQGIEYLENGNVERAVIFDGEQRVDLTLSSPDGALGDQVQFYYVTGRDSFIAELVQSARPSDGWTDEVPNTPWFLSLLGTLLPFILIGLIFWFIMSGALGGNNRVMQFGKSKAKMVSKETSNITFEDVAGVEEAMEELHEIKEFLEEAKKFRDLGAKIPRGVVLYGPPGTGKTLVAKAVAR
jgi:ATP-dependent Zn proteases